tara:strand:- start:100 stop:1986 length:1887 start_codon:yes stop_codon:yes gene_type:complete
MSYWRSDSIVHIGEEQVEIPAERGLQYIVSGSSTKVQFKVPQSIGIFSGKDSYLSWDMKIVNNNAARTRLQLDPAGGGMMCQNIRLLNNGTVIEEINEYNQLVAVKHDYDRDEALLNMKAATEGGSVYNSFTAGTQGSSKSEMADLQTNPWFKNASAGAKTVNYDQPTQGNSVKCCVPLHTGVFSGGAFPVLLMENGLTVEIDLAPAPRIVRQLDSVVRQRRRPLNPIFRGAGQVVGIANPIGANPGVLQNPWVNTNAAVVNNGAGQTTGGYNTIVLEVNNSIRTVEQCPFVVGESIGFIEIDQPDAPVVRLSSADGTAGAGGPVAANPVIVAIALIGGNVCLTMNAPVFNTLQVAAGGRNITGAFCVVSLSCEDGLNATASLGAPASAGGITYPVSYQVDNLNLVIHKLELEQSQVQSMLSQARDGSAIEFDIMSTTNYKNSLLASERQASFLINAKNQRAKALLTIPTDSTIYTSGDLLSSKSTYEATRNGMDTRLNSSRPGISGCCDQLSEYQLQISGLNVPSRPVTTRKIATRNSIDAFFLYELEKALANSDVDPRSFSKYLENFIIGRSFGTFNGATDLRNEDLSIVLRYGETLAPQKAKMFSSFVQHVRRVRLQGGFVMIEA